MAVQHVFSGFQTPRLLVGSDKEIDSLAEVFQRVCSGRCEIVMVRGHAGTGKTALVKGAVMPAALQRGYFGGGKCAQFSSGIPYSPIIQAFGEVISQVLIESQERFDAMRKKLQKALGSNGALVTDLIPRFKPLIGAQSPAEILQPLEAQNRFRFVFQKLVRVFAAKEHPLVIFLDDLQWADPATMELIRYLIGDHAQGYFLLVGAYRGSTVTDAHPLKQNLDILANQGLNITDIPLDDFSVDDTGSFIADMLNNTVAGVKPLSSQLYRRTGGNPLFLIQILKLLQDEKILRFKASKGWMWDMDSLSGLEIPDDVVKLMTAKLQRLKVESRELIKMAACIGNSFDLKTLSIACEKDEAAVKAMLQPAIRAGIILPLPDTEPGREMYEFLHDRIHQAAHSLISERLFRELHLKLGRLLLQNISGEALDESISFIMDNCNRGIGLISDASERLNMAANNLKAAQKSKNAAAYQSACEFLRAGIAFLPENPWQEHYRLAFDLHSELAVCEYLVGNIKESERISDLTSKYARTNQELSEIYNLKMVMYAGLGKRVRAVPYGIKALSLLGVNLPAKPGKLVLLKEILHIKCLLLGRKPENLFYLPEMNDPVKKSAMKIMSLLGSITNFIRPNLYILLLMKGTVLALKLGNSEMSAVAYAVYSVILGEVMGDYKSAFEFEKLSVNLAEKYDSAYAKCITYFVTGALVSHWTQPGRVSIDYLLKSVENGMQSGELLYTGYSIHLIIEELYLMGMPMADVDNECRRWYGFVRQMKLDFVLAFIIMLRRQIRTLGGLKEDNLDFYMGDDIENEFLNNLSQGETEVRKYFFDMQLCYLSGRYYEALDIAEKIEKSKDVLSGFMHSWAFRFHFSLTITAVYDELPKKSRHRYWGILHDNLREIKKLSDICPENFRHQYFLLNAEKARLIGDSEKAMSLYDQSIAGAREHGYLQIEAIANELAARYHLSMGRDKIASVYLNEAIRLFGVWGAQIKHKALQSEFVELLSDLNGYELSQKDAGKGDYSGLPAEHGIDVSTSTVSDDVAFKKAQYFIERDPEKQLVDILEVLFECAGAAKGYLILESNEELYIEAAKTGSNNPAHIAETMAVEKCGELSHTVVRYVARTQELLLLNDGGQDVFFSRDVYLSENCPKTLLCMPLLIKGILAGVIYIESSRDSEAFTPERMETLNRLCDQIACAERLQNYFIVNKIADADIKNSTAVDALTNREIEVLDLIAAGMSNKEIAENLVLSSNTIKMHLSNIYSKLQVQRRVQAVNKAKELGVLKVN